LFCAGAIIANAWGGTDKVTLKDYAIYVAQKEGINVSMFLGIIKGESGFNPNAKNPSSSASGIFQFLDDTFNDHCIKKYRKTDTMEDKNNPYLQINCAADMLLEPKGYMHWWESRKSWITHLEAWLSTPNPHGVMFVI